MFPLSFKLVDFYQKEDPILTEKLKCAEYIKGYFRGGQNTTNLVTFNDKIVTPQILQRCVVKWYHTYILHPGLDRMEAMIHQHFYCPGIIKTVQKEFTKCDVCQRKKLSTKQLQ